jgi:hypothetical protein
LRLPKHHAKSRDAREVREEDNVIDGRETHDCVESRFKRPWHRALGTRCL